MWTCLTGRSPSDGLRLRQIHAAPRPLGGRHRAGGVDMEIAVAFLIGCALGIGVGYSVREQMSRKRRRRHRAENGY
jgi:hypothetical protein